MTIEDLSCRKKQLYVKRSIHVLLYPVSEVAYSCLNCVSVPVAVVFLAAEALYAEQLPARAGGPPGPTRGRRRIRQGCEARNNIGTGAVGAGRRPDDTQRAVGDRGGTCSPSSKFPLAASDVAQLDELRAARGGVAARLAAAVWQQHPPGGVRLLRRHLAALHSG